jgi:hypothetical protein
METLAPHRPEIVDRQRPEYLEARTDVITQFSELVDGNMRTEFEFELGSDGRELYGRDGRGLCEIAQDSLDKAEELAAINPNLGWNLRRTKLEQEEIDEAIAMAHGEGPNTMIVLSDFVPELWDAEEDFGGYNVTRKQTMLRILARRPGSNIIDMTTQTLDGSNREALEAVCAELGFKPEPGELLDQRQRKHLSAEQQAVLADHLTGIYDRSLAEQYGGQWYAGRRPADYRNTYDFVCQQHDLVERCAGLKLSGQLTDNLMYNLAAAMQKRFEEQQSEKVISITPRLETHNFSMLDQEITLAGRWARAEGRAFSACGGTLTADGADGSTEGQLKLAGYGNELDSSTAWHGGKKFYNKKCVSCQEVKAEVGACHICESCVSSPSKRHERHKAYQAAKRPKEKIAHVNEVREAKHKVDNPNSEPEIPDELRKKQTKAADRVRLDNVVQFRLRPSGKS